MKTPYTSCCFCVILCFAMSVASFAVETAQVLPQDIRDKLYSCGYNSLYLFLNLAGHKTNFEALKPHVAVGENGTSLYDLQTAAAAVGMPVETVWCSYSSLCSLNMPVIAWINRNPNEPDEVSTPAWPSLLIWA